jgi:hypothetical protein
VYDWYNCFKSGQLLEDEPCRGRPSISLNAETISKVMQLVQLTSEIVNVVGISYESAYIIDRISTDEMG